MYNESDDLISVKGFITEIERYGIHDGTGIRTLLFFKGCDLRCIWCCNPETQRPEPEISFFEDKCIVCGKCADNCPYNAVYYTENGSLQNNYDICRKFCIKKSENTFQCVSNCYSQARQIIGKELSVGEIYEEVLRDIRFFDATEGGITITGGEPMYQVDFAYALLRYLKSRYLDTALETCGYGELSDYIKLLPYLNELFVDLKCADNASHTKWTGYGNARIIRNIIDLSKVVLAYGVKMYIRVPVIPGFNSNEESMNAIGNILKNCPGLAGIELLPYHKLGRGKYKSLGRIYDLEGLDPADNNTMYRLQKILHDYGLTMCRF